MGNARSGNWNPSGSNPQIAALLADNPGTWFKLQELKAQLGVKPTTGTNSHYLQDLLSRQGYSLEVEYDRSNGARRALYRAVRTSTPDAIAVQMGGAYQVVALRLRDEEIHVGLHGPTDVVVSSNGGLPIKEQVVVVGMTWNPETDQVSCVVRRPDSTEKEMRVVT